MKKCRFNVEVKGKGGGGKNSTSIHQSDSNCAGLISGDWDEFSVVRLRKNVNRQQTEQQYDLRLIAHNYI